MIIFFIIQLVLGILALVAIKKNGNDKYVILHDELEEIYKKSADPDNRKVIDELQKGVSTIKINTENFVISRYTRAIFEHDSLVKPHVMKLHFQYRVF